MLEELEAELQLCLNELKESKNYVSFDLEMILKGIYVSHA